MATVGELARANSMESWSLTGENAVVKVMSQEDATRNGWPKMATGYITQARFLKGLNSFQIERDLGLRPESLRRGAFVMYLARLPRFSEVEFRLTANAPGGALWPADGHAALNRARDTYRDSPLARLVDYYPPGSPRVKQWELVSAIPFSGLRRYVTPTLPFEFV